MKKLLTCMGLVMALATASGCEIYFGEPDDDWGDDDWGDDGGWSCYSDYDCASGCYCDESGGVCVEAGYCTADADCSDGLVCDTARNSCVPDVPDQSCWGACTSDATCAGGCYCDAELDCCVESGICSSDADCGDGMTCDESRSTCVPGDDPPPPPPPPPPACNTLDETGCLGREDCDPVYGGVNCTPQCTTDPNDPACTCESYYFAACVDAAPAPAP